MDEKKFNNALEKAENLSEDTARVKNEEDKGGINNYENELDIRRKREKAQANFRMREAEKKATFCEENLQGEGCKKDKNPRYRSIKEDYLNDNACYNNENGGGKKDNKNNGISVWIASVVTLACICLILSTVLIYDVFMRGGGETMLSNVYARSFYGLTGYVDNLDVNLSKLETSNDNENKQKILCDIIVQANLAESELATLPLEPNSKSSTEKFINQLGDFAKYLNNKLIEGDSISESDLKTLRSMRKINANLRVKLKELEGEMGEDFDFITLLSGEENAVLNYFNELEYHAVEYPKMIYDGPFADREEDKEQSAKNKPLKEISEEEVVKIFESCFAEYKPTEIAVTGMAQGGKFSVYNVEAKVGENSLFAQINQEGKLVTFDMYKECNDKKFTRDECIDTALKFLNKCGYKSIKAVWSNQGKDNVTYINFACVLGKEQIVAYADLIKVGVCMDDGMVCDMDAHLYLENHKERKIPEVKIKVEDAERKIGENIEVETSRLAVIPLQSGKEKLAYEFFGKGSEGTFYIYIDAQTGKELQIFKVIGTEDGDLLL